MDWTQIAEWMFKGGGAFVALAVANSIREMNASIKEISINVAVGAQKLSDQERRIAKLEESQ
jgi:hypothetical protein